MDKWKKATLESEILFSLNKITGGWEKVEETKNNRPLLPAEFMTLEDQPPEPPTFICRYVDDCSTVVGECYQSEEECLASIQASSSSSSEEVDFYVVRKLIEEPANSSSSSSSSGNCEGACDCTRIDDRWGSGSGDCPPCGAGPLCIFFDPYYSIQVFWSPPGLSLIGEPDGGLEKNYGGQGRGSYSAFQNVEYDYPEEIVEKCICIRHETGPGGNLICAEWEACDYGGIETFGRETALDTDDITALTYSYSEEYAELPIRRTDGPNSDFSDPTQLQRFTVIRTEVEVKSREEGVRGPTSEEQIAQLEQLARDWIAQQDAAWQSWLDSGGTNWVGLTNQWAEDNQVEQLLEQAWANIAPGVLLYSPFSPEETKRKWLEESREQTMYQLLIAHSNPDSCASGPWPDLCSAPNSGTSSFMEPMNSNGSGLVWLPTTDLVEKYGIPPTFNVNNPPDNLECTSDPTGREVVSGPHPSCVLEQ